MAAEHVLLRAGFEMNGAGAATVGAIEIGAEGGDFDMRGVLMHQDHAEVRADLTGAGKNPQ
jgi:hypothetical protein